MFILALFLFVGITIYLSLKQAGTDTVIRHSFCLCILELQVVVRNWETKMLDRFESDTLLRKTNRKVCGLFFLPKIGLLLYYCIYKVLHVYTHTGAKHEIIISEILPKTLLCANKKTIKPAYFKCGLKGESNYRLFVGFKRRITN